ncbi:MAG: response regulator [Bryobacteraceae bacterium]
MNADPIVILLVEDNPGDVFLVRRALKKHGLPAELTIAEDGQSAIQFVEQADADSRIRCPNLILLDLNLPRATGTLVLQKLKESFRCAAIPVIVMTSSDSPLDQEAAAQLGADYYFPKPTDLTRFMQLGAIARSLLEGQRQSPTA